MNPYVTHPLLAASGFLVLSGALTTGFAALSVEAVPVWLFVLIVPALVVSTLYFGREAGQREHDLKHLSPPWTGPWAYLGAILTFGWAAANFAQFAVAAAATILLAGLGVALHLWGF